MFFRDRALNLAILISAIWHLFFFCAITPIFITPGFKSYGRILVSYLGAVLSGVSPENQGFKKNFDMDTKSGGFVEINLSRPQVDSKPIDFEREDDVIYGKRFVEFKKVPSKGHSLNDSDEIPKTPQLAIVEGEAKKRELLYKPLLPTYARLLSAEEMQYEVRLRFFISYNGEVLNVEKVISSGSAMIDEIAYNYVKGLKFIPLPSERSSGLDEGVIAIRF